MPSTYNGDAFEYIRQLQQNMGNHTVSGYGIANFYTDTQSNSSGQVRPDVVVEQSPAAPRVSSRYEQQLAEELNKFLTTGLPTSNMRVGYVDENIIQIYIEGYALKLMEDENKLLVPTGDLSEAFIDLIRPSVAACGWSVDRIETNHSSGTSSRILYYNFNRQDDLDDSSLLAKVEAEHQGRPRERVENPIDYGRMVFTTTRPDWGGITF